MIVTIKQQQHKKILFQTLQWNLHQTSRDSSYPGESDRTAKSAHAEINDKACPAGADLFCVWANIAKFFSLMLPFLAGKTIFSQGGWEKVNVGYEAERRLSMFVWTCVKKQTDCTLHSSLKTGHTAAVINADSDSGQALHSSQQRKWHKNTA